MFIADYHMHTNWSHDGKFSMEKMIEEAIKKDISEICFTDHFEILEDSKINKINYSEYIEEFYKIQKKYGKKLNIKLGVEMGISNNILDQFSELVNNFKFDYVLASTHRVNYISSIWDEYWKGISKIEGYKKYYLYMLESVKKFKDFDCWGHLDYIIRYGNFENKGFKYYELSDIIDEILKILIHNGKGIEVNTSYKNKGFNQFHPSDEILKRYLELNGEIITFGSDAHHYNLLGSHIKEAYELLNNMGLKYITTFKNRKPKFIKINI